LQQDLIEKKRDASIIILCAAKLIAPVIENNDIIAGYDWIIETVKAS